MGSNTFDEVYKVVKLIPRGKVATYGKVAEQVDSLKKRITPQAVGWALHANKDPKVPCHRVVNREGKIAESYAFGGWRKQKKRLIAEGIKFKDKMHVYLERFQWKVK